MITDCMTNGPLIVTRPAMDAAPLIEALSANGIETLAAPVIDIAYHADVAFPNLPVQAILVSSANASRVLARHKAAESLRSVLTIAVGETSAQAARDAGQTNVIAAGGDVTALMAKALNHCQPADGALLYLSGVQTTGDLQGELTGHGYQVAHVVGYQAVAAQNLPTQVQTAISGQIATGVILYSPRSARIWCKLLIQSGLTGRGANLVHYCLSDNVSGVIREHCGAGSAIVTANQPTERAMLAAIIGAS